MRTLVLFPVLFTAACAATADDQPDLLTKEEVRARGKADGIDYCELFDWYGDGVCDDFCPRPDPDCGDCQASAEGELLLVALEGGGVVALDPASGSERYRSATGADAFGVVFSPAGDRAFATDKTGGTLSEIDRETGAVLETIAVGTNPQQPALTSWGRMYIPLSGAAGIAVVATGDGPGDLAVERTISTGPGTKPHILSLSPDERALWVTIQGADPRVIRIPVTSSGEGTPTDIRYDLVPRVIRATDDGAFFTAHHSTGLHMATSAGVASTPLLDRFGTASEPRKQIEGVDATADGSMVAYTHEGRRALVVATDDGHGLETILDADELSNPPYWVTLDPSREIAYVSIPNSGTVEAFAVNGCVDPLWRASIGGKPKRMALAR
jgi:hypothetical protein